MSATDRARPGFASIDDLLPGLRAGHPEIVTDDKDRKNAGSLVLAGLSPLFRLILIMKVKKSREGVGGNEGFGARG